MSTKYKCLYDITGKIEDVNTFLVPLQDLPKQEQGEPVAKLKTSDVLLRCRRCGCSENLTMQIEYTTPQQRKPLTDKQIDAILRKNGSRYADDNDLRMKNHGEWQRNFERSIARAIEAAHGIKE